MGEQSPLPLSLQHRFFRMSTWFANRPKLVSLSTCGVAFKDVSTSTELMRRWQIHAGGKDEFYASTTRLKLTTQPKADVQAALAPMAAWNRIHAGRFHNGFMSWHLRTSISFTIWLPRLLIHLRSGTNRRYTCQRGCANKAALSSQHHQTEKKPQ